jgi:hypothetical protein
MFLDIFHIYTPFIFCKKKIGEKIFKTENFIQVFVKVPIFKIFKKNLILPLFNQKIYSFLLI